jgi:hypothetical protein
VGAFSFLSFLLLRTFLGGGTSQPQRGMNESTWVFGERLARASRVRGDKTTHESNVGEEIRENPNSRLGDDDGDDPEDEANDGNGEEQSNQPEHSDTEVPHSDPQACGPQREHDGSEDDEDHSTSHEHLSEGIGVEEPDVVLVRGEELLLGRRQSALARRGGRRCGGLESGGARRRWCRR